MKTYPSILTARWMHALAALALLLWCADLRASGDAPDLDGDGIPNIVDLDVDNDGTLNAFDKNIDGGIAKAGPYAGQYIGDHTDNASADEDDIDEDGLADDSLAETNIDGDDKLDDSDMEDDIDGDGRKDDSADERDIDGDGKDDDSDMEDDIDGDGKDDDDAAEQDIDGDNKLDGTDDDIDGDGKSNGDAAELDTDGDGKSNDDPDEHDHDGDGAEDRYDDDDDNDGTGDIDETNHIGDSDEGVIELELTRQLVAPADSHTVAKYQRLATGTAKFKVEVDALPNAIYELFVGGISRGTLQVSGNGGHTSGDKIFKTPPYSGNAVLLNFEVAEQTIALRRDGMDYFIGTMPAAPGTTGPGGTGTFSVNLTAATGAPANAKAHAALQFATSGPDQLQIEVEYFIAGTYAVLIGDIQRGTITVTGNSAALVFKTSPGVGELPLNFLTSGQSISIIQGSTSMFFGTLPTAPTP
ncbi:MAG: hypothetical protein ABL974_01660 [Prosthecobacter sp.]